jgi:hypothetical protein
MLMSALVLTGVLAAICAPGLIAQSRAGARHRDPGRDV